MISSFSRQTRLLTAKLHSHSYETGDFRAHTCPERPTTLPEKENLKPSTPNALSPLETLKRFHANYSSLEESGKHRQSKSPRLKRNADVLADGIRRRMTVRGDQGVLPKAWFHQFWHSSNSGVPPFLPLLPFPHFLQSSNSSTPRTPTFLQVLHNILYHSAWLHSWVKTWVLWHAKHVSLHLRHLC